MSDENVLLSPEESFKIDYFNTIMEQALVSLESRFEQFQSDGNDISFVIKYNGKFENIEGEVLYVGGSTHVLETAPQALFIGLKSADIVDMYCQRIWYKLPYEELKELKILCDGGPNFESMCRAASWSRVIEVFMEHDDANDGQNDASRQNGGDGHNDGDGQSDGDEQNDGDGQHDGAATNPPYFHEAERVEEIVAGFVDEEEEDNEAYRNTPPQSDCEEDQNEIPYDRWRRGSGELKIMLLFDSVKEFREAALNNFSESYNSGLEKARSLPLVEMLETMRRQTMVRIDLRKKKINKHKAKFSLKVAKTLALEEKEKKWCKRTPGPNGYSEVSEKGTSHTVNIDHKTCTCRRWDVTGIPCRHALKVFTERKLNAEDYVADCYLTTTWKNQYSDSIIPVDGLKFWKKSDEQTLQAPPREIAKGRKKNPEKRKKGIHESPTKGKKVTSHLKIVHCVRCGFSGHNATKCGNDGVPNKSTRKPRAKKQKTSEEEPGSFSLDVGEGPSQPTQTSYAND